MKSIPSILDLAKVPSEARIITKPNGKPVTVAEFVRCWKLLKTLPPDRQIDRWDWFPSSAASILRDIWLGVQDRINIRGGLRMHYRENSDRTWRKIRETVKCECEWCGSPLPEYKPKHARFCDAGCRRAYSGY